MPSTTKALREKLVAIAISQFGVREKRPNEGPQVRAYQAATWYPGTGWAWCSAFVCWCVMKWGYDNPEVIQQVGLDGQKAWEQFRPKTPAAFGFEEWATSKSRFGVKLFKGAELDSLVLHTGDIIIYKLSHIGIIDTDNESRQLIYTIEGNSNDAGSREGDGVYKKTRKRDNTVRSIVRIME